MQQLSKFSGDLFFPPHMKCPILVTVHSNCKISQVYRQYVIYSLIHFTHTCIHTSCNNPIKRPERLVIIFIVINEREQCVVPLVNMFLFTNLYDYCKKTKSSVLIKIKFVMILMTLTIKTAFIGSHATQNLCDSHRLYEPRNEVKVLFQILYVSLSYEESANHQPNTGALEPDLFLLLSLRGYLQEGVDVIRKHLFTVNVQTDEPVASVVARAGRCGERCNAAFDFLL